MRGSNDFLLSYSYVKRETTTCPLQTSKFKSFEKRAIEAMQNILHAFNITGSHPLSLNIKEFLLHGEDVQSHYFKLLLTMGDECSSTKIFILPDMGDTSYPSCKFMINQARLELSKYAPH